MAAYYNEIEPFAADWLEGLIEAGLIAPGVVDRRSIEDVQPADLEGFTQCHFFAWIGGWSLALRMAGWPDDRPVWTGSCPCQPFSSAGKQRGTDDERHVWPAFHRLIAECRPATCFGEQVASADGRAWLAGVFADLEALAYAVAGADLCAACVGAPHIRQRLYWLADRNGARHARAIGQPEEKARIEARVRMPGADGKDSSGLSDAELLGARAGVDREQGTARFGRRGPANDGAWVRRCGCTFEEGLGKYGCPNCCGDAGAARWVGHADHSGREQLRRAEPMGPELLAAQRAGRGCWEHYRLVECREPTRDGGTRTVWRRAPAQPALQPVADGLPGRVGLLRGSGNAIVPQVAAEFIGAWLDVRGGEQ